MSGENNGWELKLHFCQKHTEFYGHNCADCVAERVSAVTRREVLTQVFAFIESHKVRTGWFNINLDSDQWQEVKAELLRGVGDVAEEDFSEDNREKGIKTRG